jgi:hypothetical protein
VILGCSLWSSITTFRPSGPNVSPATLATYPAVRAITRWHSYPKSMRLEKARLQHPLPTIIIVLKMIVAI